MQTTDRIKAITLQKAKECCVEITALQKELFERQIELEIAENRVKLWEAELELEIAEDSSLRNEAMRKSQKIITLSTNADYLALVEEVTQFRRSVKSIEIALHRYQRGYEIASLEAKVEIAELSAN